MKESRRSKVRETVKLPEEGHRERRQASRVWDQGKKAKPKATLDRTGSEQPSTIEDMEHERVRKVNIINIKFQTDYNKQNSNYLFCFYVNHYLDQFQASSFVRNKIKQSIQIIFLTDFQNKLYRNSKRTQQLRKTKQSVLQFS
ncbi:Hypothetical_protein [Hexamita inflata]|uniref:Hypothetical_protein n=1 Tax=Hexamita inflata TaxID=28002 RepID=A0AA86NQV2_9EUKA|nr:Hypothetical protein HINF_LOCUS10796 [Hexamita inflata]